MVAKADHAPIRSSTGSTGSSAASRHTIGNGRGSRSPAPVGRRADELVSGFLAVGQTAMSTTGTAKSPAAKPASRTLDTSTQRATASRVRRSNG